MSKTNAAVLGATAVAIATYIAGCMYQGRDFDATKAQAFQKGKTSKTDVIAAMGDPSSTGGTTPRVLSLLPRERD